MHLAKSKKCQGQYDYENLKASKEGEKKEKQRAYNQSYMDKNRSKILEHKRDYDSSHREQKRETHGFQKKMTKNSDSVSLFGQFFYKGDK